MPVTNLSRYKNLKAYLAFDDSGETHATLPLPESTQRNVNGSFERIVVGIETMETLAAQQYGLSHFWWRIADANPLIFPLDLRSGMAVTVPPVTAFNNNLRRR